VLSDLSEWSGRVCSIHKKSGKKNHSSIFKTLKEGNTFET